MLNFNQKHYEKVILVVALVAAFGVCANAQFYLGGSIGFSSSSENSIVHNVNLDILTTNKSTGGAFSFSPEAGYQFNEKNAAGLIISISPTWSSYTYELADVESKSTIFNWAIEPYYRYKLLSFNKFGVWGQAYGYIGGANGKNDDTTNEKTTKYGLGVLPVLTFSINEHFTLVSSLGLLSLGWNGSTYKNPQVEGTKITTSNFNLGINGNTSLSFGAFYCF